MTQHYYPIQVNFSAKHLQKITHHIVNWSTKWKIKINPEKCETIKLNNKNTLLNKINNYDPSTHSWTTKINMLSEINDHCKKHA